MNEALRHVFLTGVSWSNYSKDFKQKHFQNLLNCGYVRLCPASETIRCTEKGLLILMPNYH